MMIMVVAVWHKRWKNKKTIKSNNAWYMKRKHLSARWCECENFSLLSFCLFLSLVLLFWIEVKAWVNVNNDDVESKSVKFNLSHLPFAEQLHNIHIFHDWSEDECTCIIDEDSPQYCNIALDSINNLGFDASS